MEKKSGGKEQQRIDAEGQLARSRAKLEALAKGMVTDEEGHAATLDSQLTGVCLSVALVCYAVYQHFSHSIATLPARDEDEDGRSNAAAEEASAAEEEE